MAVSTTDIPEELIPPGGTHMITCRFSRPCRITQVRLDEQAIRLLEVRVGKIHYVLDAANAPARDGVSVRPMSDFAERRLHPTEDVTFMYENTSRDSSEMLRGVYVQDDPQAAKPAPRAPGHVPTTTPNMARGQGNFAPPPGPHQQAAGMWASIVELGRKCAALPDSNDVDSSQVADAKALGKLVIGLSAFVEEESLPHPGQNQVALMLTPGQFQKLDRLVSGQYVSPIELSDVKYQIQRAQV